MNLIFEHPAIAAIAIYWAFSAFVGGMPVPKDSSSSAYTWLYNSLHILAGNLSAAVAQKYPSLPSGTVLRQDAVQRTTIETPGGKTTAALLVGALLMGSISLAGCSDFERRAYQTLAASKAVVDQAQADYESGKIAKTQTAYDAINKAKDAQTAAVKVFQDYETAKLIIKSGGDLSAQQQAVADAIAELGPTIAAVKNLYKGAK